MENCIMNELQLVKSEHFGEIKADIYSNGSDMFMTINQLAACLEYSGRDGIEKMVERNPYLRNREFSVTDKLSATDGKTYETRIFTEDGIYEVTMLSSQSKAKEFRAWIRGVLKSIRKHGLYATDELLENPAFLVEVAIKYKQEYDMRKVLQTQNLMLEQKVAEYEPKVQYLDNILKSQGVLATTQIAADYGLSAYQLNKILFDERIQRKVGGQWILYREHMNLGYTKSETIHFEHSDGRPDTKLQTKWTQKGRLLIHGILEHRGILANMDRLNLVG